MGGCLVSLLGSSANGLVILACSPDKSNFAVADYLIPGLANRVTPDTGIVMPMPRACGGRR